MKRALMILCLGFMGIMFLSAQELDSEIQKAVDGFAKNRVRQLDVSIGAITFKNTDAPTEVSLYLRDLINHYATNNRMFRVVPMTRGPKPKGEAEKGIITGNFSPRGDMVDINILLNSDTNSGANLGSARITVPAAELTKRGLNLVFKNEKEQQIIDDTFEKIDEENKIEEEKKKDQKIKPVPSINIQAWFDSESRTFMHRDELKMTVGADKNCYFKIIHIDSEGQIKMIYPNTIDKDNYLKANATRTIFESAKYFLYGPYGAETIIVVASSKQFDDIEQQKMAPWSTATVESVRAAVGGKRGGDLEIPIKSDTTTGKGEARYTITILEPSNEYEYRKPSNMTELMQDIRDEGGVFGAGSNETSGYYTLNNVRASYRIPRDKPDTIQFAMYNLATYTRGGNASVQTRGSGFNFEFAKPGNISQAVQAVRSGIEGKGGTFTGNEQQGSFNASGIAGQYRVSNMVNVTITEKPFLIPNSLIRKEVESFFGGR